MCKKTQFCCLYRCQFCKCGHRFYGGNTRNAPNSSRLKVAGRWARFGWGRLPWLEGRGSRADQPVHSNILASVYLSTVGRLSAAFHNPDSPLPLFFVRSQTFTSKPYKFGSLNKPGAAISAAFSSEVMEQGHCCAMLKVPFWGGITSGQVCASLLLLLPPGRGVWAS